MSFRVCLHDALDARRVSVPDGRLAVALYAEHRVGRMASERKDDKQRSQRPCERP